MARYKVNHSYACDSAGHRLVLAAGSDVELDEAQASFVERDSPGCLTELTGKGLAKDSREVASPPKDRKMRRRDWEGDPADEGAMSRADQPGVVR